MMILQNVYNKPMEKHGRVTINCDKVGNYLGMKLDFLLFSQAFI